MKGILALTRSEDNKTVLVNMNTAVTAEPSYGDTAIRFNADRSSRNLVVVSENLQEIETRLPEGWTSLTRRDDGKQILVNISKAVSLEPSYGSALIRFDANRESWDFITVKETLAELEEMFVTEEC